jgi:hypothetical protein
LGQIIARWKAFEQGRGPFVASEWIGSFGVSVGWAESAACWCVAVLGLEEDRMRWTQQQKERTVESQCRPG